MKKILFTLGLVATTFLSVEAQELKHLARFETGMEDASETLAYDATNQHAVLTNSSANNFMIVDLANPTNPTLVRTVDLSTYGAGPNSIAVINQYIAVAVESENKQENGYVVVFDLDGNYVTRIETGALPDMLAVSPDGTKVLVANEGEPNDDYTVDPEGSVTVIDLNGNATHITFDSLNNQKASLINKGVRIFGNNGTATVAQDLEPEYITFSADSSKAFVSCQENNAIIVIDLTSNSIVDVMPLGYKNHLLGTPSVQSYNLNEVVSNWPSLGTPVYDGGQDEVMLGGFSGMYVDQKESTEDKIVFYVVPDRGPNASPVKKNQVTPATSQNVRPFKLPNYQARIVKFTADLTSGEITLDEQIMLTRQDGTTPITGKGNIPGFDEIPVTYADGNTSYATADYTDANGETYTALPYDAFGGDFEGVVMDNDGNIWLCDEYRPALYKFNTDGTLVERFVAEGTSQLGDTPVATGTYGTETLPEVYSSRRANRGFEAIAYDDDHNIIYAWIQTPLYNPSSETKNNSDVIRILGVDAESGTPVAEYVYLLENNKIGGYATSRVDKIGDAVYKGNGQFIVAERDSSKPDDQYGKKFLFEMDLNFATNILGKSFVKPLETMTADEIIEAGINPVNKIKMLNTPSIGYEASDKLEGVALVPGGRLALMNDNDFGLAGAGITDNSVLGIVSFQDNYGFDASDKDEAINITSHPTYGMYMPDAIASYEVNGVNYIVTANEGDSRDYDGYSEEERVKKLTLNPAYFPNAEALQEDENLGRLKTTTANGDLDGDGTYEQIFSYGGRSFSIFDEYGNLIFDSANDFAQVVADVEPEIFNQKEGKFDSRSDDKGVEPEAVAIGEIDGKTYAFIGLERQNGIMVYDITHPWSPEFITYYNNDADIAPEIIKFLDQDTSPNGTPMLLVGYEVSGTMGIIQVGENLSVISEEVADNTFKLYPNPVVGAEVQFNKEISGTVYNYHGQVVQQFQNETKLNVSGLPQGIYIIKTLENGTKRFMKK
ncbi:T9SS type A sorting domain-containing protein [Flavobacteriaceae bacterium Ap0902]|nr:T9SS type A sorting domain-containing protein [Flavobacteriaceae bacterium Ap0902]